MSRRKFLKDSLAFSALPFLTTEWQTKEYNISNLSGRLEDSEDYWKQVRMQFPLRKDQTYFNNGTMGPTPGYVLQKMVEHMSHYAAHAAEIDYKNGSGPQLLSGYFPYVEVREKIGKIINADYRHIALTQNATFGMNYMANGLEFDKGDEIINTDQEHGGGFAAWQQLAKRRGCVYKQAKLEIPIQSPEAVVDTIFKEVTTRTKIIAIPHIVSSYGTILPVAEICRKAKEREIFTIIDGAQAVGQIDVDVQELGCDAYYSSLHKWLLAPAGSGILYINPDRISEVWTTIASYNWDNDEDHGFRLTQGGTGNPAMMAGLDAALDFFESIGKERWLARVNELGDHLRDGLSHLEKVTVWSSPHPDMQAGITTYAAAGLTGPQLQKLLWEKERLQPRSIGSDVMRHSTHIYNSKSEIDRALNVIEKYV